MYVNVQPIQSPTGETVIGVLYVKSNLENKYQEITNTASIFFTASIIAAKNLDYCDLTDCTINHEADW